MRRPSPVGRASLGSVEHITDPVGDLDGNSFGVVLSWAARGLEFDAQHGCLGAVVLPRSKFVTPV